MKITTKSYLGGDILTPETLSVENGVVTLSKRNDYLIGTDSINIPLDKVSGVRVTETLISATISISSMGSVKIQAEGFTIKDARKIKELILNR